MSIRLPYTQTINQYSGSIQANDNSTLHLGDNYYYGGQERLRHVPGALFDSYGLGHRGCHPETRRELLAEIETWIDHPTSKAIFWLNGAAGTGKSTIAYTVAQRLSQRGAVHSSVLGASFFFKRGEGEQASAVLFFPTIAHELCQRIPGLDSLISAVVRAYPDICNKSLSEQFKRLIQEPLTNLDTSKQTSTYIVVVDALDECEKDDDTRTMLQLYSQISTISKGRLRMFLTSRPELPIRLGFSQMSADVHQDVILHTISKPVIEHDILVYLTDAFAQIRNEYNLEPFSGTPLAEIWPSLDILQELTNLAVPLFIIAVTICRFVHDQDWDPQDQLNIVLKSRRLGHKSHIAQTYLPILQRMALSISNAADQQQLYGEFRLIVGAIVTLFEPLSRTGLASLLNLRPVAIATRLRSLHSVLSVPLDPNEPIRPLHLSFSEFLASEEIQDQPFYVDNVAMHGVLATKCLTLLSRSNPIGLFENMCQLNFPGQARRDVPRAQILAFFSSSIQYACRYWVHHFHQNRYQLCDHDEVHIFLQKYFLHWLEAMSLLDLLGEVIEQLWTLQSLISNSHHNTVCVAAFLEDARRFVLANLHTIDLAPLQIYSSALIFAPHDSIVRQIYAGASSWVRRYPITPTAWNALLQTLEGHQDTIRSLTFSSDGSTLASASDDATVRLWNVKTGQTKHILGGHGDVFSVVAFSPDGSILASGSDEVVYLWDVKTGQIKYLLEGHMSPVLALSFSLDGFMLASVSRDAIVQLWNVETGRMKQTFGQCKDELSMAVAAFSPEGLMLAHSSDDTLQLWNVRTGRTKIIPMGHTEKIIGVAFSPCGSVLASVSDDTNVHLWDRKNNRVKHRLIGHAKLSSAVTISTKGSILASAFEDNTICLRDAETSEVKQTMEAHTKNVGALAFSPDGSMLASGSDDTTIRLWDIKSSHVEHPSNDHTSRVLAVAFSPDGSTLVSASADMTVQLWNAETGSVEDISTEPRNPCSTAAFSADASLIALAPLKGPIRLYEIQRECSGHRIRPSWSRPWMTHHPSVTQEITTKEFSPHNSHRSSEIYAMALSPHNSILASVFKRRADQWIAFSQPDSYLARVSETLVVELYHLHEFRTKTIEVPEIHQLTFSANGRELLTDQGIIDIGREFHFLSSGYPRDIKKNKDIIILKDEWVQYEGRNVLWLPHEYRSGVLAVRGSSLAIYSESNHISFLRFDRPPRVIPRPS